MRHSFVVGETYGIRVTYESIMKLCYQPVFYAGSMRTDSRKYMDAI